MTVSWRKGAQDSLYSRNRIYIGYSGYIGYSKNPSAKSPARLYVFYSGYYFTAAIPPATKEKGLTFLPVLFLLGCYQSSVLIDCFMYIWKA